MKHLITPYCALALLGLAPLTSQASGVGGDGRSLGLKAPKYVQASKAQDGPFGEGTNALNLGIGFGTIYGYVGGISASPAFSASFEHGFKQLGPGVLGFGALLGYQGTSGEFYGDKLTSSDIIVSLRGAYHYPVTDAFDAYAGIGLGFRSVSYKWEGSGSSYMTAADYSGMYMAAFVGGRYFFSDAIGAFAELGYDQAYIKAGVTLKF